MSLNYSKLSNSLTTSLEKQNEIFHKQLILNPVENIPDPKYLSCSTGFLHGIYNSDKLRSENEMMKTKIQYIVQERYRDFYPNHSMWQRTLPVFRENMYL